jgi:hypothetical protein
VDGARFQFDCQRVPSALSLPLIFLPLLETVTFWILPWVAVTTIGRSGRAFLAPLAGVIVSLVAGSRAPVAPA